MSTRRVFLDANVIIECFRTNTWFELAQGFNLETVEECEREALTGSNSTPGRVQVDPLALRNGLRAVHAVIRGERNKLLAAHWTMSSLDPGERDLYAHLHANNSALPNHFVLSTADKGAVVRANDLGWLDHLASLEELLTSTGTAPPKIASLGVQYRSKFLTELRTKVRLGIIP